MASDLPVLIAGGGIGGLTTALALGRLGIRVHVLEQSAELGAIGYGIQLGPNAFHVFDRLGLSDDVLRASDQPRSLMWFDALTGAEVTRVDTGAEFKRRFGYPYIFLHRVDLHHILVDACRAQNSITLDAAATVTGYTDEGDHVAAITADGRRIRGSVLVGADGLRSRIRAQMLGESEPRMIGYVAHRTIVPIDKVGPKILTDVVALWGGPGFHIVHYPLRHHTLFNIVAVFRTSTFSERGDVASYRAELMQTYRDAHPSMQSMIAMMDLERRWPIADRDPIRRWHKGRVVLMGDAAHPTLQTYAQGACMAIEDAVCLAGLIAAHRDDPAAAFTAFEASRGTRTARIVFESRYVWEQYHAGEIERDVVHSTYRTRTQADAQQCLAWIYDGYRPPAEAEQLMQRRSAGE